MSSLALYGTEFAELDDEDRAVSKKPTPIQDQIATDERGKRRFHGAFTGGFSAGYFNTVGTKQGWTPQEFRSSRDDRSNRDRMRAEDFMDDEDLGEFGIAQRKIRQTTQFGGGEGLKRGALAWERGPTSSSTAAGDILAMQLEKMIRPVSDSIGVRLLKQMGWRQGRGVGLATARKGRRDEDEEDARQRARVAGATDHMTLDDEEAVQLRPLDGVHGIGYQGIAGSTVLSEQFGKRESALRLDKRSRGIRGQAFGVGAFEEDDESVYQDVDLSQYDFALEGPTAGGGGDGPKANTIDASFQPASDRLKPRTFYLPSRLPANFQPYHKTQKLDTSKLPEGIQLAGKNMNAVQRAKFFGENRASVLELVGDGDRKKLQQRRSRWDQRPDESSQQQQDYAGSGESSASRVVFPDEPMKQARFKEYLNYLRRGLVYQQPRDMSTWEWEAERGEFEGKLLPAERALLPEVQSRAQPLAPAQLALPLKELLQSKFAKETGESFAGAGSRKDEDKRAAVKMGMFGLATRERHDWYPAYGLAKLFNVPHPYPGATMVGCLHMQRTRPKETLVNLGLPNTANELAIKEEERGSRREKERVEKMVREDEKKEKKRRDGSSGDESEEDVVKEEDLERPPADFFACIFGGDSSSESEEEEEEEEAEKEKRLARERREKREKEERQRKEAAEKKQRDEERSREKKKEQKEGVQSLTSSGPKRDEVEEFGPAPPPAGSDPALTGFSVLRYLKDDLKQRKKEKKAKKDKEREKEGRSRRSRSRSREHDREKKRDKSSKKEKKSKKDKKEKKSKKEKKEKRGSERRRSASESSGTVTLSDSD